MARKLRRPTITEVKKFLSSAAIDVNDRDLPAIALAVSGLEPHYLRRRAIEYLHEAEAIVENTIVSDDPVGAARERIKQAIGLLAIAALRESDDGA